MANDRSPTLIGSVQRALHLLDTVGAHGAPMTAKALARATGQQLPTTYHLLRTLVYEGYLQKVDGGYVLGDRFAALAQHNQGQVLAAKVHPVLRQLHDEVRAAAYLSFYQDGEIDLVSIVDSPGAPRVDLWVGFDDAAHATALGKCVLACLPEDKRSDYLSRHSLTDLTPRTITNTRALLARLNRQRDYAYDEEEYALGTACVATPVITSDRIGAVAISVSNRRLQEVLEDTRPLTRAAHRLALALSEGTSITI